MFLKPKALFQDQSLNNDVDWFNEEYQNRGQCSGMIIGDNGVELLVLTKYSNIESCDGINVTFVDDTIVNAVVKKYDVTTNLAVISINLSDISENTKAEEHTEEADRTEKLKDILKEIKRLYGNKKPL